MQKAITLSYSGKTITLSQDAVGRFNLNELHQLSTTNANRRPGSWLRSRRAAELENQYSTAQKRAVLKVEGRGPNSGSWVVEEMVYAYAEWVSADFHKVVLDAFTAAVKGDGEKAVKIAQSVVRVEGIAHRKVFAQQLARHGATKGDFGSQTDVIYLTLHGKPSSGLKKDRGIKKSGSLRDSMSDVELQQISAAESLATLMMMKSLDKNRGEMRKAVFDAAQLVKNC